LSGGVLDDPYSIWPIAEEMGLYAYLALLCFILVLAHWALMSLGSMLLLGRWWIRYLVLAGLVLLGTASVIPENSSTEVIQNTSSGMIELFLILGTVFMFFLSVRLKLISTSRITLVSVAYLMLLAFSLGLSTWLHSTGEVIEVNTMTLMALCILPFAAIGGTPLAVRSNRHR